MIEDRGPGKGGLYRVSFVQIYLMESTRVTHSNYRNNQYQLITSEGELATNGFS